MARLKVHKAFDEFLKDPNLSLRAKGFLTMVLTNNITTGFEVEKYCSDSKEDIKDALLELRIAKYVKYDPETKVLMAGPEPYPEWDEAITKDLQRKARKHAEQER